VAADVVANEINERIRQSAANKTERILGKEKVMKKIGEMKMQAQTQQAKRGCKQYWVALVLVTVGIIGFYRANAASPDSVQSTFATPAAAGQAMLAAAQSQDEKALEKILGPDSQAIFKPGDAKEDKAALMSFAVKYDEMNRWVKMTDGSEILNIGADNYPFPIPLVQDNSLNWHFDTEAGKDEILARRIGRNELLAIDAVSAIANAEELYAHRPHDGNPAGLYTTKIFSTAGKQDGLYWPVADGEPSSPLGRVEIFARDALSTPNESPIIDGYSFRILTAQAGQAQGGAKSYIVNGEMTGGFAVIASPGKYGDSGVMTFVVSLDGVVYQQDLGPDTDGIVDTLIEYNPTNEWEPVK
jgi:hypothetical protein